MKKINKIKPLLILIIAVLCITLTVILALHSKTNGHYVATEYEEMGITLYIDLDDTNYNMVATSRNLDGLVSENKTTGTFEIKGDLIIIDFEGSELTGSFNRDENSITLNGIKFVKE